jgi:PAS domain S-box-containing protein
MPRAEGRRTRLPDRRFASEEQAFDRLDEGCRGDRGRGAGAQIAATSTAGGSEDLTAAGTGIAKGRLSTMTVPESTTPAETTTRSAPPPAERLRQAERELEAARARSFDLFEHAPVGYVTLDAGGRILQTNRETVRLLGLQAAELIGRRLTEFMAAPDRLRWLTQFNELRNGAAPRPLDMRLASESGTPPWVSLHAVLVAGSEPAPQCRVALMDISERVAMQDGLARLAAIVASSDDAIISRSLEGRVTSWNGGAERLFGWRAADMMGRTLDRLLPEDRADEEFMLIARVRRGDKVHGFETERLRSDGTPVALSISVTPILDEHGRLRALSTIARDIGERGRAERALRKRLGQLDVLSQAGAALIMGARDAEPLQQTLLDRVRQAVGAEIGLHFGAAGDSGRLHLVASCGLSLEAQAALASVGGDDSLCGLVLRERRPVVCEDLQTSTLVEARTLQREGVRAYAGFPLLAYERVAGVAAFASTSRDRFAEDDLQVMRTVCGQVSAMLERAELLQKLHAREQALQRADRRKDDFIATLAHELRNPLAPMRHTIAILRGLPPGDARLGWCRDVLDRQITQMTRLLDDLLDISRVTRNQIVLRRQRVAVGRVVDEAVEATRPLFEARRHTLALELPAAPLALDADPTRLAQVLTNLLDNAARYTEPGGRDARITLWARAEGGQARIGVKDEGCGMDVAQLADVFERFAQLTPALQRTRGGLGIGLSLSRALVEQHGGRIEAHSGGPGRGSEFIVTLPLAAAAAAAPGGASAANDENECTPGEAMRVLVVDDNNDAAESLAMMLNLCGIDARCAFDGAAGLALAEHWQPQAAIVDIGMPVLNGYELAERLRGQPWGRSMFLVACTGWGQDEDRMRARAAGFDLHVVKPVDPEIVRQALRAGVAQRG